MPTRRADSLNGKLHFCRESHVNPCHRGGRLLPPDSEYVAQDAYYSLSFPHGVNWTVDRRAW